MNNGTNTYLQVAKNIKNDEFYTKYEDIEKEVSHYSSQLAGKTIYCNCDDPFKSNFCKFFINHFNQYKLKRLICTSLDGSQITATPLNERKKEIGKGYILDVKNVDEHIIQNCSLKDMAKRLGTHLLNGDGSFQSEECIDLLRQADVIITNPPFSAFKEMVSVLTEYNKKFLLIGNMNAITYKEIFPLIKNNKAWLGYHNGDMSFRVPEFSEPRKTRFWIDESGQKWRSMGNAMWFTNLDVSYRHQMLELTQVYSEEKYPYFDNYDAINVSKVAEIPADFDGIMAVPLTILTKYNPDQFEIIGEANHGSDNCYDLFKPTINEKEIFKRILIQKNKNNSSVNRSKTK